MTSPVAMFQTISNSLAFAGLACFQPLQGWRRFLYQVYVSLTIALCLYEFIALTAAGIKSSKIPYFLILGCVALFGVFETVYFWSKEDEFRNLLEKIASIDKIFSKDPLMMADSFHQSAKKYIVKIQFYMLIFIVLQTILPVLNGVFKYLRYSGAFKMDGEVTHMIPPLNNVDFTHQPILFGLELVFETVIVMLNALKPTSNDCFFICLYLHLASYFKHLRISLTKVFNKDCNHKPRVSLRYLRLRDNIDALLESGPSLPQNVSTRNIENNDERLKKWISMHQSLLTVSQELISLYNPMLLVQFSVMYFLFVVVIFTLTTEQVMKSVLTVCLTVVQINNRSVENIKT